MFQQTKYLNIAQFESAWQLQYWYYLLLTHFYKNPHDIGDIISGLFIALEFLEPSILRYTQCLCCWKHKHNQFLEFRTLQHQHFRLDAFPAQSAMHWDHILHLIDTLVLAMPLYVLIQSIVVFLQEKISQFFRIWDLTTAMFTTFDVLQLLSARPLEPYTTSIQCGESHRAICFAICSVNVVLQV